MMISVYLSLLFNALNGKYVSMFSDLIYGFVNKLYENCVCLEYWLRGLFIVYTFQKRNQKIMWTI